MMNYAQLRQPAFVFLAVGAVLGLGLGLLIGWVFWPVEWTGATLRDLNRAEKAEYIAAVADAFVIYDSPEMAAVSQRRLAPLDDGNLAQTLQDALTYFGESQFSDRAIRDSNIRRLAVALNMSPPSVVAVPQEAAGSNAEATATSLPQVVATPLPEPTATSRLGWVGWLLWFLTALLLLVGGIYILNKTGLPDLQTFFKPRTPAAEAIDEFEPPQAEPTRRRGTGTTIVSTEPGTAYSFDQEEDEWPAPRRLPIEQSRRPEATTRNPYQRPVTHAYDDADLDENDFDESDIADYDVVDEEDFIDGEDIESDIADRRGRVADDHEPFDDEDDGSSGRPTRTTSYTIDPEEQAPPNSSISRSPLPPTNPADGRRTDRRSDAEQDPARNSPDQPSATLVATAMPQRPQAPQRTAVREGAVPALRTRSKVIDQHIFHYQIGMAEYEVSLPIVDPQSKKYVGEFGMSTGGKNTSLQTGTDQPVALEIWLFDKADERNVGTQTRILLSEYAVDHHLEPIFLKERQDNPRPFTAQPGIHFQLESQNFLLDCTIVDVEYSTSSASKGVFQKITVDTTVLQKGQIAGSR